MTFEINRASHLQNHSNDLRMPRSDRMIDRWIILINIRIQQIFIHL